MKTIFPTAILLGGIGLAAIMWLTHAPASAQSDEERILGVILDQRQQEQERREQAAELMKAVLPAPASCDGLTTQVVFDICATEPDPGGAWPDWKQVAAPAEQACLLGTFHQTNAHAFTIRGETYEAAVPDNNRMGHFVTDLCTAALWTDGIDYGDTDKPLPSLIEGYYAHRATSRVTPAQDY